MHEVLYAMAGSQCQLADPQHVEAISGNVRQVFEDAAAMEPAEGSPALEKIGQCQKSKGCDVGELLL